MSRVSVTLPSEPKSIWDLGNELGIAEDVASVLADFIENGEPSPLSIMAYDLHSKVQACAELADALMKAHHAAGDFADEGNVVPLPVAAKVVRKRTVRR